MYMIYMICIYDIHKNTSQCEMYTQRLVLAAAINFLHIRSFFNSKKSIYMIKFLDYKNFKKNIYMTKF